MRIDTALDQLIDLEERVGRVYTRFYGQWSNAPAVGEMWWEMALEEHGHAGVLKMVKQLSHPAGQVADIRSRLRPLQAMIKKCEQAAAGHLTLTGALAMAVRLEHSELDRLGREMVLAIRTALPIIPRSALASHEAHLERLMRSVRKFGGEEVAREAWELRPEARARGQAASRSHARIGATRVRRKTGRPASPRQ